MPDQEWLDRERRTARLIRACYAHTRAGGDLSADALHALCRLTWITAGRHGVADSTQAVVVPALSDLLGVDVPARSIHDLGVALADAYAPPDVVDAAMAPVGFTNYYNAFRNTSRGWVAQHRRDIGRLFDRAWASRRDADLPELCASVEALPPVPRAGGRGGAPASLLTPVLACLDPRERTPIVNGRASVVRLLRGFGLSSATLVEQAVGLRSLIGIAGIDGALAIDCLSGDEIDMAQRRLANRARDTARRAKRRATPLAKQPDEDVEYFRTVGRAAMKRLHNAMTNALLDICARADLEVEQGTDPDCRFDALVRHYRGTERHLH